MKLFSKSILLFAVVGVSPLAMAQDDARQAQINNTIEMIRTVVQAERQAIVTDAMQFSASESELFWPLYREYRNDMSKVLDRRAKLIKDFAAEYGNLSDETAERMLKEFFDIENDTLKVKKRYVKKFQKILPPVKVTRFYQVENKLDAIVRVQLAQNIPFVQ